MKILMTEQFLPESVYTLELVKEMRGFADVSVFCRRNAGASLTGVKWLPQFYENGKKKLPAVRDYFFGLFLLAREIRRGHYDVVHVQTMKDAAFEIPLYLWTKKNAGILVHTVHNLLPHEASAKDRERYGKFYNACDLLMVHNRRCMELLKEEYGISEEKIRIAPHGTYSLVEKAERKRKSGEKTTFLQFGIMRKYKGIDLLLRAVSLIPRKERTGLRFVIAGARHEKLDSTDYEAMVRELGIEDAVELRFGHIPDAELKDLFARVDICLFPYREIYGSGALLMAYSYEKPVIASDIPVFLEETENGRTGLCFQSGDPKALKEAILKAASWSQEEYDERVRKIRLLTQEKYNWAYSAGLLLEAYQEIWDRKKC